jgi:arylsulfatase A-like enzyme
MLTRREWLAGSAALSPAMLRGAAGKINVVFIMTDDHGAWAVNSYGDGARFTPAYACAPACFPIRMT